jgi:DNA-directed RNA polymerase specialized sigma24 family protein
MSEAEVDRVAESAGVVPAGSRPGRDAEFAAFMAEHADDLLRTAWLLVGDAHRAEELAQAALVRTYTTRDRIRSDDPLGYARRVLANLRVDELNALLAR